MSRVEQLEAEQKVIQSEAKILNKEQEQIIMLKMKTLFLFYIVTTSVALMFFYLAHPTVCMKH